MRAATAVVALAAALLLAGCASSPQADLNQALTTVTDRANAGDANGLRAAVNQLVAVINRQTGSDLTLAAADRLRADAARVLAGATLLDTPTPTPAPTSASPTESPTPSATPSPTPTPSPSPSPTPSPTPTPTPTPTRTKEPTKTPSPSASTTAPPSGGGSGQPTSDAPTPSGGSHG